jgi:hypothetical protein
VLSPDLRGRDLRGRTEFPLTPIECIGCSSARKSVDLIQEVSNKTKTAEIIRCDQRPKLLRLFGAVDHDEVGQTKRGWPRRPAVQSYHPHVELHKRMRIGRNGLFGATECISGSQL